MSQTFVDVPQIVLQNKHEKVIRESPNLVSILPYRPISVSNNTIGFVFQTPSFNTLMSEKVLLSFQSINLNFQFNGTIPSGTAPISFATLGGLALRSFPMERLINTAQIVLGSSSVSFPISDILEATAFASYDAGDYADTGASFERPPEEVGGHMGAQILAGGNAGIAGQANLLCAQTSSSTGSFIVSGVPSAPQKGGSLNVERISGGGLNANGQWDASSSAITVGTVSVRVSMSGFLKLPILQWLAKECKESLSCLSQIQINLILQNPQNIVSYLEPRLSGQTGASAITLQNITFDPAFFTSSNITLSVRYITPPSNYSMKDIVRQYFQLDRYITTYQSPIAPYTYDPLDGGTIYTAGYAKAGQATISSNSFTLPAVPRYLMFYVKPLRNYYNSTISAVGVPNFYLPIVQLNLTLGNRTAQLSSSPYEHLYSMSVESGLRAKWTQYRGYGGVLPSGCTITAPVFGSATDAVQGLGTSATPPVPTVQLNYEPMAGAPLILDLSTTLGLSEELCIGRNVPISLQASVQVINTSGMQVNAVEFFVLAITQAYLNIDHMNGNSVQLLGAISAEEALQVASMDLGTIDNKHQTKFAGGFSFSDVVSKVKGALPMVKNVAKSIAGALENAGYGTTGAGMVGAGQAEGKKLSAVMKKMKMMAM
jgi:hypothetical protein